MNRPLRARFRFLANLAALAMALAGSLHAEPSHAAVAGFNQYVAKVEARLDQQHHSPNSFLAGVDPQSRERLERADMVIESLAGSSADPPGALLHHWRGTAFISGANAQSFESLLRNFTAYPQVFAPQVLRAGAQPGAGDHLHVSMRVRQKHVLTVVLDTDYDVSFGRFQPGLRYSASRSTRVAEIESPGSPSEHALGPTQGHGFLWRINTYWSWEERDGGLFIQIESVTLTRSIPAGLGWAVRPFVESVPRESLEFTLRAAMKAMQIAQTRR